VELGDIRDGDVTVGTVPCVAADDEDVVRYRPICNASKGTRSAGVFETKSDIDPV